jgi:dTDP-4-amino-4,6-dideoxygalactose transaminase
LDADPEIGAVIAVHLYGHCADIGRLSRVAAERKAMVIEDAAQALGGRHPDGRKFGAGGDLSVTSFGHSKILDVGGGGLLLTDNDDLAARAREHAQQLPLVATKIIAQQATNYSRLYYALWDASLTDKRFLSVFKSFPALFQNRFINAITSDLAERISAAIPELDRELGHRRALYADYLEMFRAIPSAKTFQVDLQSIAPWRFSCRVPATLRDRVLMEVRNVGYDASAWYPDLAMWSLAEKGRADDSRPVAEAIEREVVNFWVTSNVSQNDVARISEAVLRVLGEVDSEKN